MLLSTSHLIVHFADVAQPIASQEGFDLPRLVQAEFC